MTWHRIYACIDFLPNELSFSVMFIEFIATSVIQLLPYVIDFHLRFQLYVSTE